MNTIVQLTNGKELDVRDVKSYVVDSPLGKKVQCTVYLNNGTIMKISMQDLECIETFRRELNEIKNEE